jgi:hypothetical protein
MKRRAVLAFLPVGLSWSALAARAGDDQVITGKLRPGEKPVLAAVDKEIALTGDKGTLSVLADERLKDAQMEMHGAWAEGGVFKVGPLHTRAMYVLKGGQKLMISYWCSVCSIRTYTPGKCMCCQDETDLDLRDKID